MKSILVILFFLFLPYLSFGQCTRNAQIQYKHADGSWSKKYLVEVNFIGGPELNQATQTNNYYVYGVYAVVFWSQEQVTVIDIGNDNFLSCTASNVDCDCINDMTYNFHGEDQNKRYWEICIKDYCY